MQAILFVGGERIVQPLLFKVGDVIPTIAACVVSLDVYAMGALVATLTVDDGLVVDAELPPEEGSHITFTIDETITRDSLKLGRTNLVRPLITKGEIPLAFAPLWLTRTA